MSKGVNSRAVSVVGSLLSGEVLPVGVPPTSMSFKLGYQCFSVFFETFTHVGDFQFSKDKGVVSFVAWFPLGEACEALQVFMCWSEDMGFFYDRYGAQDEVRPLIIGDLSVTFPEG